MVANAEAERAQRLSAAAQAAAHVDPATLSISSSPEGATVFLNHDSIGTTPLYAYPVASGAHLVSLGEDGIPSTDTLVLLSKGQSVNLTLPFPSRSEVPDAAIAEAAEREDPVPQQETRRAERSAPVESPASASEEEEEPRFVRVRTQEAEVAPFEPEATPLPETSEPTAAEQAPRQPARSAAPQAEDIVWIETKEERQQRVSGYVRGILEQRRKARQAAGGDSVTATDATSTVAVPAAKAILPPPDTTLAAQQEKAREIIRKHEGEQGDEGTKKKRKKKRGAW
ncbi:MAG: PEGA domain-containing protein [Rhodothermales bacterium]